MKTYTIVEHIIKKSDGSKSTRQQFPWYCDKNKLLSMCDKWINRDMSTCLYMYDNPKIEIIEKELENTEVVGLVHSYGEYEDYTVVVGDIDIARMFDDNYQDINVKITIEVLK